MNRLRWPRAAGGGMTPAMSTPSLAYPMPRGHLAPALVLTAGASLTQLDVTAMAVALPGIAADLRLDPAATAWIMNAYSLAFASLLLGAGALADRFGRRRALLAGIVLFAVAALSGGLAWDAPSLLAARAVQGAGAALLIAGGLASLSLAYPAGAGRARAFAVMGVASGAAMALGPAVGGYLAAGAGWRWIFWMNLPVCALAGMLARRVIAESRDAEGRALDLPGLALLSLAFVLPVHGMLQAGAGAWRWAGIAAGAVLAVLFVLQQRRRPRPMLDPVLFARREPVGAGLLLLILSVGYWAVLIYLPPFLQAAFGFGSEATGMAMLLATLPMLALPPLGARLVERFGIGVAAALGLGLVAIATAALAAAAADLSPSLPAVLAAATAAGAGAGLINTQVSAALIAMAPAGQAGMASAVSTTLRQAGFAFGIALLGLATQTGAAGGAAYARPFLVAAAAAVSGAAVALWLLRPRRTAAGPRDD